MYYFKDYSDFNGTLCFSAEGFPDDITTYGLISGLWASSFSLGDFIGPSVAGALNDWVGFRYGSLFIVVVHVLVVSICPRMEYKLQFKDLFLYWLFLPFLRKINFCDIINFILEFFILVHLHANICDKKEEGKVMFHSYFDNFQQR